MPATKKQMRVTQKGKKEPMRYMAVSSAVYKLAAAGGRGVSAPSECATRAAAGGGRRARPGRTHGGVARVARRLRRRAALVTSPFVNNRLHRLSAPLAQKLACGCEFCVDLRRTSSLQ